MKIMNLIGIVLLTVLLLSCNTNGKPKNFDYGKVENDKYVNSFFGLEMKLPSDWVVQTKEQIEHMVKRGKDLTAGDDENMKAIIKASEINSANLLSIFQYEVGAPVDYNPNLTLVAENIKSSPGIKTGSDYLFQARKLLKQSQMQYDYIDEEFKKEIINNKEFYTMNTSITYMELTIKQVYYSTIQNEFCVSAIITFVDDKQKKDLEEVIYSMKFEN